MSWVKEVVLNIKKGDLVMSNYELLDELHEVMYANVLTSERQSNIMAYSLADLLEGLYERINRDEEFRDEVAVYGESDFSDRLNRVDVSSGFTSEEVRKVLFGREYSLEYKLAMVGEMTENEVRDYYWDACAVVPSMFQLSQDDAIFRES